MYEWKVREGNGRMKSKRKKRTNEKYEKEMYKWKVRERNVHMQIKRRECTNEK